MVLKTLESKVRYRIRKSKGSVFVPDDFAHLSDRDQVGRALRALIEKGELIKFGQGLYAKAKRSSVTGNIIPQKPLPELAQEALEKMGIEILPSDLENRYNRDETTQVPTGRVIRVKGRVSRRMGYDGKYIAFEKAA